MNYGDLTKISLHFKAGVLNSDREYINVRLRVFSPHYSKAIVDVQQDRRHGFYQFNNVPLFTFPLGRNLIILTISINIKRSLKVVWFRRLCKS